MLLKKPETRKEWTQQRQKNEKETTEEKLEKKNYNRPGESKNTKTRNR